MPLAQGRFSPPAVLYFIYFISHSLGYAQAWYCGQLPGPDSSAGSWKSMQSEENPVQLATESPMATLYFLFILFSASCGHTAARQDDSRDSKTIIIYYLNYLNYLFHLFYIFYLFPGVYLTGRGLGLLVDAKMGIPICVPLLKCKSGKPTFVISPRPQLWQSSFVTS